MKQFYWFFRPLALIGKVFCVLPLENILLSDPKHLKYHKYGVTLLFTGGVFGLFIFMIFYYSGLFFVFKQNFSFSLLVLDIILLRSLVCFLLCGYFARHVPRLVQLLDLYDKRKFSLLDRNSYSMGAALFFRILMPFLITCVVLLAFFLVSHQFFLEIFLDIVGEFNSQVSAYFFAFLCIWQVLPQLLYIYFAITIYFNFEMINYTMAKRGYFGEFLKSNEGGYNAKMGEDLSVIRLLHNMLGECVSQLGHTYGDFLAVDRFCIVTILVINLTTLIQEAHNLFLVLITIFNCVIVIVVIYISHAVKEEAAKLVKLLNGIPLEIIDERTKQEVQMILLQNSVHPIRISAGGYFVMDRSQILHLFSSVATYLIVMIQFMEDKEYRRCCLALTPKAASSFFSNKTY